VDNRHFEILKAVYNRYYHADFMLVQVGANDGVRADPIRQFIRMKPCRALLAEPLPDMVEALQSSYSATSGVTICQMAVHDNMRSLTMYGVRLNATEVSDDPQCIASAFPNHHKKLGVSRRIDRKSRGQGSTALRVS